VVAYPSFFEFAELVATESGSSEVRAYFSFPPFSTIFGGTEIVLNELSSSDSTRLFPSVSN